MKIWGVKLGLVILLGLSFFQINNAKADSTIATVGISPGTLGMEAPQQIVFNSVVVNGYSDIDSSAYSDFKIADNTGSGHGWNLQLAMTTFTSADGTQMPDDNIQVSNITSNCYPVDNQCLLAAPLTANISTTVPSSPNLGKSVKIYDANHDSGMAPEVVNFAWRMHVPFNARVGEYTSTWAFTLASGP